VTARRPRGPQRAHAQWFNGPTAPNPGALASARET
jgi:hypothetical protein